MIFYLQEHGLQKLHYCLEIIIAWCALNQVVRKLLLLSLEGGVFYEQT